jgi:hypothetical protein
MEQRYQAVLAVIQDGWKVVEVADRLGVSRQAVHSWIARYQAGGPSALADRSHRPASCPHQIAPGDVEQFGAGRLWEGVYSLAKGLLHLHQRHRTTLPRYVY